MQFNFEKRIHRINVFMVVMYCHNINTITSFVLCDEAFLLQEVIDGFIPQP